MLRVLVRVLLLLLLLLDEEEEVEVEEEEVEVEVEVSPSNDVRMHKMSVHDSDSGSGDVVSMDSVSDQSGDGVRPPVVSHGNRVELLSHRVLVTAYEVELLLVERLLVVLECVDLENVNEGRVWVEREEEQKG